jgi:hypothetical protein
MASGTYDVFKVDLMDGTVNISNGGDTVNVALYDNSHAFTATDTVYTNTNELATAGGYTQTGVALANQAVSMAANTATFDADDLSWTSATFSTFFCVIYDVTNTNSLIATIDFGGAQTVTAGTFTIQWHANGIISLT